MKRGSLKKLIDDLKKLRDSWNDGPLDLKIRFANASIKPPAKENLVDPSKLKFSQRKKYSKFVPDGQSVFIKESPKSRPRYYRPDITMRPDCARKILKNNYRLTLSEDSIRKDPNAFGCFYDIWIKNYQSLIGEIQKIQTLNTLDQKSNGWVWRRS